MPSFHSDKPFGPAPKVFQGSEDIEAEMQSANADKPADSPGDESARAVNQLAEGYRKLAESADGDAYVQKAEELRLGYIKDNNVRQCFANYDATDYDCRNKCPHRQPCNQVTALRPRPDSVTQPEQFWGRY